MLPLSAHAGTASVLQVPKPVVLPMLERRSIRLPIVLGVLMILTLVALTIGWVLLNAYGALADSDWAPLYWTLLTVGTVFLVFVLVGVIIYLTLSIQAISLNRRQANFIDSVTHELKSPIASLKLYLQTLGRREVTREEQGDFFRFMLDDVERLDRLINHLLDAARLNNRGVDSETQDVDVADILERCVHEVALQYNIPDDAFRMNMTPIVVRARAVDLTVVFRNLIDNAVKYAGVPPAIVITARCGRDHSAIVRIEDNGSGIPPQLRRKIFGRFVRVGEELERETPGTGLGLYIVRTLVQRLHGKIRVHSRAGGPGTAFVVELPIGEVEGEPTKEVGQQASAAMTVDTE